MERLSTYVIERVDPDGGVREPCQSRVLESALTLALLRDHPDRTDPAARIAGYLRRRRDTADPLDQALIAAACGSPADHGRPVDLGSYIAQAPDFTTRRKRVFFEALLIACGAEDGGAESAPAPEQAAFSHAGLHPWAEAQTTAVKVIWATARGAQHRIEDRDIELLVSLQNQDEIWEGNLLVHLSALHALHRLGGHEAVVRSGADKVLKHQRRDGGIPFFTDTDTWCTATAGVALMAAGAPDDVIQTIADNLVQRQKPNGGWSVTDIANVTDIDDTSVILELLQTHDDPAHEKAIERGRQSLLTTRGPDGGFPTYVAGAPSEMCMTAAAINALSCRPPHDPTVLPNALEYLAGGQREDGTFPPDWSASRLHVMFRAVLAVLPFDVPRAHTVRTRAFDHILRTQNADGGWGQQPESTSDPVSTAYALIALCHQPDPRPVAAGIEYLMARQNSEGSIDSISDSIGLRFPRDAERVDRGSDGTHERNTDHGRPQKVLVGVA
ncbi:terpene cyclase/mutase family protein [Streptomyces sp. B-S-A8]|uniref:Terpene cyclase/mutase family protein n=1 Tax=Streptomyces solicavernae TaxID=3043614 RepID=A0ABT6S252_9ACTN|nr:prenyltransferase/squalene oxidase repeat-containing protein [Streptomyces sp. B-S-A8]MDI3390757.1 terpene cyclase/mutase family protein [Streptomyces sp. B-S-A8]